MGNHQSHGLQQNVIAVLRKETDFSVGEISDLYRQFRTDTRDLSMTVQHFINMYSPAYPHGQPENLAQRIFSTFDQKKDGRVDFHEFLAALNIQLKGSVKMKQEWVFDVIDHRQKGAVDIEAIKEVIQLLEGLNAGLLPEDFQSIDSFHCEISTAIGECSSKVTKKDFVNAALAHDRVRQLTEAVIQAALMPYEMRRERTGSYGRARTESIRARAMTNKALPGSNDRMRTHTVN